MQQFTRGYTATFYCTYARLDGTAVDPTSPTVEVWQGAVQIVPPIAMTQISVGFYYAEWVIPGAQATGIYTALYKGIIDGIDCQGSEDFQVILQGGSVTPGIPDYYCSWDDVSACLLGLDLGCVPSTLMDRMTQFHIPAVKNEIDSYCRQNFNRTTVKQFFDGSTTEKIVLPRRPIRQLTYCVLRVIPSISWYTFARWRHINVVDSEGYTIATQGGPEPHAGKYPPYSPGDYDWEDDIVKADLFVDCANGILTIPPRILYLEMQAIPFWNYTFLKGNANVEVWYEYGYDETNFPRDLRLAAAKLAACQLLLLKGIFQSSGANSVSIDGVSRNFGGTPYTALIEDMRKQAYATLDRFRRMEVG